MTYGVWVGTPVGVKLAVGVELGGTKVEVEVGSGPNCSLQAESENRMQIADNRIWKIGREGAERYLGW